MGDVVGRRVERSLRCVSQIEPAVMTDSPPLRALATSASSRVRTRKFCIVGFYLDRYSAFRKTLAVSAWGA